MQVVKVQDVTLKTVQSYLAEVEPLEENSRAWVRATVDPSTATILLTNGKFAKGRTAYGAFIGDKMVGYAINYDPDAYLDLLHVHPEYRGRGIAQELIGCAGSRKVAVQPVNTNAVRLYEMLGLEIDFDEEV